MQWRIQDFPEEGAPTPPGGGGVGANIRICQIFPKNCMKLKDFGPGRGPSRPPYIRHCNVLTLPLTMCTLPPQNSNVVTSGGSGFFQGGEPTYYFWQFSPKSSWHWNKNWTERWMTSPPPLRPITGQYLDLNPTYVQGPSTSSSSKTFSLTEYRNLTEVISLMRIYFGSLQVKTLLFLSFARATDNSSLEFSWYHSFWPGFQIFHALSPATNELLKFNS